MPPSSLSTSNLTLQRWRSRAELRQAYLDSLPPEELRRVHPARYWLRFGRERWERDYGHKANFNAEQPRDNSGQWVAMRDRRQATDIGKRYDPHESFAAARRRGRSIAFCMAQYAVDGLMCNSVEPASRRAGCWKQAAERLGSCLAGREIPPLTF